MSAPPYPSPNTRATHHGRPRAAAAGYEMVMPWLAGLTVVCSSTALAGVINHGTWLGYVTLTMLVVVCAGLALRALRIPTILVAIGQMLAVACLATFMFTRNGVAGVLPGPGALAELGGLLTKSVEVIRSGVPPVDATAPILCLAVISIGLVNVIVDILVAPGQAPAAAGLMLLCVYAVPASLSDEMLPWWTFALGAMSFALLLAVDRAYRQRAWTGRADLGSSSEFGPTAAAIAGMAMVVALLAGTQLVAIGTEGRLPGTNGDGSGSSGPSQLGIKPFTTLRGMLDKQDTPVELFRVRGLGADAPYLRSLTLRDYQPDEGWRASKAMARGVAAGTGGLPAGPGDSGTGQTTPVRVESVNWLDVWLPVYGIPRKLQGVANGWRYDNATGIVYSQRARNPGSYTEQAMLAEPTPRQLRAAPSGGGGIDPSYTRVSGVDRRVVALTKRLVANATNNFDKALALYRYFTVTGGFSYDTRTALATDSDALADFVLKGRTGFCEQYASAMAVMLRAIGVPSRVAIGFTPGQQKNGYRSITSRDAHAWVEVFFPGQGWQAFDPTPLTDGRTYTPTYLATHSERGSPDTSSDRQQQDNQSRAAQAPSSNKPDAPNDAAAHAPGSDVDPLFLVIAALAVLGAVCTVLAVLRRKRVSPYQSRNRRIDRLLTPLAVLCWLLVVLLIAGSLSWWLLVLPIVLALLAAPVLVRMLMRARRVHIAAAAGAGAAEAAWAEVVAASTDRGVPISDRDTVRTAATTLIRQHGLDAEGQRKLRSLVQAVERTWYGGDVPDKAALAAALDGVLASLDRNAPLNIRARLLPTSVLAKRPFTWQPVEPGPHRSPSEQDGTELA